MNISVTQAADICGGKLSGVGSTGARLGDIVIDSRAVKPGDLFVAYKGEHTDGHAYIQSAFEKGAAACLAERLPAEAAGPVILVPDVQAAVEKLCIAYRDSLSLTVLGISGSVGKTTAKEMLWSVLSEKYNVLKTEGNLNNHIGVPMTISRIRPEHQAAVVEMGISGFGEMSLLAKMARPDIALFTMIGHAHLEALHNLEGVFKAKTEMLDFMPEGGTVIINGDDPWLNRIQCRQRLVRCGLGEACDVRARDVKLLEDGRTL